MSFLILFIGLYVLLYHVLGLTPARGVLGCGLYGFNGAYPADITKIKLLAVENQSRGNDSVGYYTIKHDKAKTRTLFKKALSAKVVNSNHQDALEEALKGAHTVIAHTRSATSGTVSELNAHPFEYDFKHLVIGAHNGFLIPQLIPKMTKELGFDKEFAVDSQLIFAGLSARGDYKILPQYEGAVTITYVMPDLWPGYVFLYKRAARVLHWGRAKEGIYWSSESEPLRQIGIRQVNEVPDDSLMIVKDGQVVDITPLPTPTIKLGFNSFVNSWQDRINPTEYEKILPELAEETRKKQKTYYTHGGGWRGGSDELPFSSTPSPAKSETAKRVVDSLSEATEDFIAVVDEVVSEVEKLTAVEIEHFTRYRAYPIEDATCCLVVIKLKVAETDEDLPGWVVYDSSNKTVAGITAPNGVTVLKYPAGKCNGTHTIKLSDPVEGNEAFKYDLLPKEGEVIQLVLGVPFQKKTTNPRTPDVDSDIKKLSSAANFGRTERNVGVSGIEAIRIFEEENKCALPGKDESVHLRSEKKEDDGVIPDFGRTEFIPARTSEELVVEKINQLKLPITYDSHTVVSDLITRDKGSSEVLNKWEPFKSSMECEFSKTVLTEVLGSMYNVDLLLFHGWILKHQDIRFSKNSRSLLVYCMYLLKTFNLYYGKNQTMVLSPSMEQKIASALQTYMRPALLAQLGVKKNPPALNQTHRQLLGLTM